MAFWPCLAGLGTDTLYQQKILTHTLPVLHLQVELPDAISKIIIYERLKSSRKALSWIIGGSGFFYLLCISGILPAIQSFFHCPKRTAVCTAIASRIHLVGHSENQGSWNLLFTHRLGKWKYNNIPYMADNFTKSLRMLFCWSKSHAWCVSAASFPGGGGGASSPPSLLSPETAASVSWAFPGQRRDIFIMKMQGKKLLCRLFAWWWHVSLFFLCAC